jgi:hypothetical protein
MNERFAANLFARRIMLPGSRNAEERCRRGYGHDLDFLSLSSTLRIDIPVCPTDWFLHGQTRMSILRQTAKQIASA